MACLLVYVIYGLPLDGVYVGYVIYGLPLDGVFVGLCDLRIATRWRVCWFM